jgi:PAS domain S-box-containing protein
VIWFHCEAKMIRKPNGEPWFIHGVGFDITDLKRTEEALQEERNVVSAILHTVGALVVVLDPEGRIIRCNRAYEQTTGYSLAEVTGQKIWDLFMVPEEVDRFQSVFQQLCTDQQASDYEMACDDTPLRGSRLVIEDVPVIVFCPNCNVKRPLSSIQLFCCGECGTPTSEIVQGKELEVVALEIQ